LKAVVVTIGRKRSAMLSEEQLVESSANKIQNRVDSVTENFEDDWALVDTLVNEEGEEMAVIEISSYG
jgi:hypothetical protein